MAAKLKFLLTEKTLWRLVLSTAVAVAALILVRALAFHPLAILGLFFVFLIIYFRESQERRLLRFSFLLLLVLALVGLKLLSSSLLWSLFGLVLFAAFFFTLLGLINLYFKERFLIYSLFNTALLLLLFLLVFYFLGPKNFWALAIVLFLLLVLIFKEVFKFFEVPQGKKTLTLASVLALLGVELTWIISFLALRFLGAALLVTLFFLLVREALLRRVKGALNFSFVFLELTFFVVLVIIIFATSQ